MKTLFCLVFLALAFPDGGRPFTAEPAPTVEAAAVAPAAAGDPAPADPAGLSAAAAPGSVPVWPAAPRADPQPDPPEPAVPVAAAPSAAGPSLAPAGQAGATRPHSAPLARRLRPPRA